MYGWGGEECPSSRELMVLVRLVSCFGVCLLEICFVVAGPALFD
jgi:hypothetical protein